jgi:cobalt-zinc-cadmium efflux system protein
LSENHNHINLHNHSTKNIRFAFFLNFGFAIIEFIGGFLTNSVAILTDAVHDLGDSVSLGMSWYLENVSKRKKTKKYSYGYTRFSLLAALININILIIGSVLILKEAISRLYEPQEVDAKGMFLLSILGIIVNSAAVLKLKKGKTLNEKVVMLHLMEDVLGWVAIFIGSIIMYFKNIPILDPILSLFIAAYILFGAYKNLKKVLLIFLQGVPANIDLSAAENDIKKLPHVEDIHDIHLWSLDGDYHVFTAHIVFKKNTSNDIIIDTKRQIHQILSQHLIPHATLEIEFEGESCYLEHQEFDNLNTSSSS